jgi:hypothetical protein
MKIINIIRICFYSLLVLFGLVFVVAGIVNIRNGLMSSVASIISGLMFSLYSLRNLIYYIMAFKSKDEDFE